MKGYFETLRSAIQKEPPKLGDTESILKLLYEAYNALNTMDDDQIKADFNALYQAMNGIELREMDRILAPVCALCRDHEQSGFRKAVKVGISLMYELIY